MTVSCLDCVSLHGWVSLRAQLINASEAELRWDAMSRVLIMLNECFTSIGSKLAFVTNIQLPAAVVLFLFYRNVEKPCPTDEHI